MTEWLFVRKAGGRVSEAVWVSGLLLAMVLPPTIPLFMVVIGGVFAISFGKMAFGGFGANVFNPAMTGRVFLYITFPLHMTSEWIPAASLGDFPGGLTSWLYSPNIQGIDAVTTATYSHAYRMGAERLPSLLQLFLGDINGVFNKLGEIVYIGGGSAGETSAFLLICGGLFLVAKKIAKWRLVTGFFVTYAVCQIILHAAVPHLSVSLIPGMLSGGALLGGFFMVTDPVSATKTNTGQWIYASLIALSTSIIRTFSLFAGGLMFSILLGNMFGPLIDYAVKASGSRRKPS